MRVHSFLRLHLLPLFILLYEKILMIRWPWTFLNSHHPNTKPLLRPCVEDRYDKLLSNKISTNTAFKTNKMIKLLNLLTWPLANAYWESEKYLMLRLSYIEQSQGKYWPADWLDWAIPTSHPGKVGAKELCWNKGIYSKPHFSGTRISSSTNTGRNSRQTSSLFSYFL